MMYSMNNLMKNNTKPQKKATARPHTTIVPKPVFACGVLNAQIVLLL